MSFSTSYAAKKTKMPASDASSAAIKSYVDSNDISKVPIKTLLSWQKTRNKDTSSNTVSSQTDSKIMSALKNKEASDINNYVKNKDRETLKNTLSIGVINAWKEKDGLNGSVLIKLREASKDLSGEIAEDYERQISTDPTVNPDAYKPGNPSSEKIADMVGPILGAINNIGVVIAVIILMIIGLKYMLGSAEEKANYKQTLMPYLIGAVILFAGSIIPNLIYKTMK